MSGLNAFELLPIPFCYDAYRLRFAVNFPMDVGSEDSHAPRHIAIFGAADYS